MKPWFRQTRHDPIFHGHHGAERERGGLFTNKDHALLICNLSDWQRSG
jgi:hypothetical protein